MHRDTVARIVGGGSRGDTGVNGQAEDGEEYD
jgi:hypothetical protein